MTGRGILPSPHRVTTAHLQGLYPFVSDGGLGSGVYVGHDMFGGPFAFDPWELYASSTLTNPNMVVIGQIGRGKSALVKTWLWRQLAFGRQAWIIDPKGEYGLLARWAGTQSVRLAPGGDVRLNPLDAGGDDAAAHDDDTSRRQIELVAVMAAAALGRPLLPRERTAAELALVAASTRTATPTLPLVVDAMLHPSPQAAASIHVDGSTLASDGRDVALELRRLCEGDLRGMFDGATSASVDLRAPVVVLDLSAVYTSASALGVLIACAVAWLQSTCRAAETARRVLVVDEAWAVLSDLAIARWLRSSFKLSRALGVANLAVVHRVSDLAAAGAADSEQVRVAHGLLADAETRVVYGQPPGEVDSARSLLGLTQAEAELLPRLPRGTALWKVGTRAFLVVHRIGRHERPLIDTDARMSS